MRLTPKAPFPEKHHSRKTHAVLRRRTFQYLQALCSPELPTVLPLSTKDPAMLASRIEQLKSSFYPCSRRLS